MTRLATKVLVIGVRLAKPAPAIWNMLKTLAMIALFDAVVVRGIPMLILLAQHANTGLDLFFPPQVAVSKSVLGASTLLVLWAGMMLAIKGQGTPLPFDAPQRLVIGGPYAWLRTPMVTGTLGQVIGVSVMTGSVIVLLGRDVLRLQLRLRREEPAPLGDQCRIFRGAVHGDGGDPRSDERVEKGQGKTLTACHPCISIREVG